MDCYLRWILRERMKRMGIDLWPRSELGAILVIAGVVSFAAWPSFYLGEPEFALVLFGVVSLGVLALAPGYGCT